MKFKTRSRISKCIDKHTIYSHALEETTILKGRVEKEVL